MKSANQIGDEHLRAVGIDLTLAYTGTAAERNDFLDGKAVAQCIHNLAEEAGELVKKSVVAKADTYKDLKGMTDAAIEAIKLNSEIIAEEGKNILQGLEEVRKFRMTITAESTMIETAIKKIQALSLQKLITDLNALTQAMNNPHIQSLLKANQL